MLNFYLCKSNVLQYIFELSFGKSILIIIIGENGAFYGKMTHSILVILSKYNMYDVNESYP